MDIEQRLYLNTDGFGASVIALLRKAGLTKNLYFEHKEKIIEEKFEGPGAIKKTKALVKVYGLDSTKNVRELLMEILRERMDNHKDKFVTRQLYDEFIGLEIKRNGKIEHSANTHDDLTFSYLMALYVWYEGKDLKEIFGITKQVLKTDDNVDDIIFDVGAETVEIYDEIHQIQVEMNKDDPGDITPMEKFKAMVKAQGITYQEWEKAERAKEDAALKEAFRNPEFLKAYAYKYNMSKEAVDQIRNEVGNELDPSAFTSIYSLDDPNVNTHLAGNLSKFYDKV